MALKTSKKTKYYIYVAIILYILKWCSGYVGWMEEVRLADERVIKILRISRCSGLNFPGCNAHQDFVVANLPEFSDKLIVWHEHLNPMIFNIYQGRLYIVATPPYQYEYDLYGKPEPFYVCYLWEGTKWNRVPLDQIPLAIYDNNLLISNHQRKNLYYISIIEKDDFEFNNDRSLGRPYKRIDPLYITNFYKFQIHYND